MLLIVKNMKVSQYVSKQTANWGYILVTTIFSKGKKRVSRVVWSSTGHTYKWNDFSSAKLNQSITRPNQVYTQPTSGNLTVEYLTFLTNKLHVIDVDDLDGWNQYCSLDFSKASQ